MVKTHQKPINSNSQCNLTCHSHAAVKKAIHLDRALTHISGTRPKVQTEQAVTQTDETSLAVNVTTLVTRSMTHVNRQGVGEKEHSNNNKHR